MNRTAPRVFRAVLLVCAGLSTSACSIREEERAAPAPGAAVLQGQIRLEEGAVVPAYRSGQVGWRRLLDGDLGDSNCAPSDRVEVLELAPDRGLGGVVVAASGFTGKHLHPKQTHEVVFEHCRLSPSMVSATTGDLLEVENRDEADVPVTYGASPEPLLLRSGARPRLALIPGVESLMCPPEVGCGRTDVVTFHHSMHAVTDARGRFKIEGFPVGQPVTVHAWHPLLREAVTQVWLGHGELRDVTLVVEPKRSTMEPAPE